MPENKYAHPGPARIIKSSRITHYKDPGALAEFGIFRDTLSFLNR
jgi:hypothetical protein